MTADFVALFGGMYADGAKTTTAGKPLIDGSLDLNASSFPREVRKQNKWLNVNTTVHQSIVTAATIKTIGVSIKTQVDSPSKLFNKEAEELIEEHAKKGVGELTGRHHFNSSMRTLSDFDILDGGIIMRHHYHNGWGIPYKYELVGVDMIDVSKTEYYKQGSGKGSTVNGLVRNKWGKITHIWLYTSPYKTESKKVSTKFLTYHSDVWISIDQQTAVSKLVTMLSALDQSLQYGEAELQSAIEASKAGAYLQSQAYDEVMKVVTDRVRQKVPNANKEGAITEAVDIVKPILRQFANTGVIAGGLSPIPAEDNIIFNPSKSDSQYKTLNDNTEMKMASSQGMSSVGVFRNASDVNYSGIKAAIEMDQLSADVRFDNITNSMIEEMHKRLVMVGVQIGRITNRRAYWENPNRFNKFRYLRQNKIDIEPAKNALANKTNIELGIATEADIIEKNYGIKYEDWVRKNIDQRELKADKELQLEIKLLKKRKEAFERAGIEQPIEEEKEKKQDEKTTQALLDIVVKEIDNEK